MKARKFETINCPKCNYEYLPSEIYIPKYFFGTPYLIERDNEGKITNYEGSSIDLFENYTCDKCGYPFRVCAKMQFTTQDDKIGSFDEDYSTPINEASLVLEES